jgi:hypothetical protein
MNVCMYVYCSRCKVIDMYLCIYTDIVVRLLQCMYVCMYAYCSCCVYVRVMFLLLLICMYVCMHVCMYVYCSCCKEIKDTTR